MRSTRRGRGWRNVAALLGYAALAAFVFWPLPTDPTRMLARGGWGYLIDLPLEMFTLAWESRALVSEPWRILEAPMFHPAKHVLLYGPTAFGVLPIFAPIYLLTGEPALALNGALLVSLVLTAWAAHIVVRRWTGLESAAIVAGTAVLTAEWLVRSWVPTAVSYAAMWWFPLLVSRVARPIRSWRDAATIALLAWLQSLADVIYVAPVVLAPLGVLGIVRTLRAATRRQGLALLAATTVALAGLAPLLAAHAWIARIEPDITNQGAWLGAMPERLPESLVSGVLALGPAVWALLVVGAIAAIVRRARGGAHRLDVSWRALVPWVVVGLAMSFERGMWVLGVPYVNRPLELARRAVPMLAGIRTFQRYRIATLVGLVLAAGLAFAEVVSPLAAAMPERRRSLARGLVAAVVVALMVSTAPGPGGSAVSPYRPPEQELLAVYAARTGPVLEVPTRAAVIREAMITATYHRRPIVNGYDGYFPHGFPKLMALADRLPEDLAALQMLRATTGITTIVVTQSWLSPEERERWLALADAPIAGLHLRARLGSKLVFDVGPAPTG